MFRITRSLSILLVCSWMMSCSSNKEVDNACPAIDSAVKNRNYYDTYFIDNAAEGNKYDRLRNINGRIRSLTHLAYNTEVWLENGDHQYLAHSVKFFLDGGDHLYETWNLQAPEGGGTESEYKVLIKNFYNSTFSNRSDSVIIFDQYGKIDRKELFSYGPLGEIIEYRKTEAGVNTEPLWSQSYSDDTLIVDTGEGIHKYVNGTKILSYAKKSPEKFTETSVTDNKKHRKTYWGDVLRFSSTDNSRNQRLSMNTFDAEGKAKMKQNWTYDELGRVLTRTITKFKDEVPNTEKYEYFYDNEWVTRVLSGDTIVEQIDYNDCGNIVSHYKHGRLYTFEYEDYDSMVNWQKRTTYFGDLPVEIAHRSFEYFD